MGKISSVHDTFIRSVMAEKSIAVDYFQNYLPSVIATQLDFSTLTQLPDIYVSAQLQKSMSDIVYSCERKDGKGQVRVSLLIEHKSYPDKFSPVQIGSYIFSGLQKQIEKKEKQLSPIIPILLYHGKEKWEYRKLSDLFEDIDSGWKKFLPDYDYVYNNLGELTDIEVEALNNKFLAATLLALKHTFDKQWLEVNILRLLLLAQQESENLLSKLIVYIFERSGFKEDQITITIETLPEQLKNTVMSTLDIFVEKGEKIGIEKGEKIGIEKGEKIGIEKGVEKGKKVGVENMLLEGFGVEIICKLLAVTPEFVENVRAGLNR